MISIRGRKLWVDPNGAASQRADFWRESDEPYAAARAAMFDHLATVPTAKWLTSGSTGGAANHYLDDAANDLLTEADDELVTFVLYNIPVRDLRGYSGGGAASASAYRAWVDSVAAGLQGRLCEVVVEPDALPHLPRMTATQQAERLACLAYAVEKLTAAGALCYLDAGDSGWIGEGLRDDMAARLLAAGIVKARGFATNVAHFRRSSAEHEYAADLIRRLAAEGVEARYIVDTSRNGRGPYAVRVGEDSDIGWCNPPNAGFGAQPSTVVPQFGCDGRRWVKSFSSDGSREGAPPAGQPYDEQVVRMWWAAIPAMPAL